MNLKGMHRLSGQEVNKSLPSGRGRKDIIKPDYPYSKRKNDLAGYFPYVTQRNIK